MVSPSRRPEFAMAQVNLGRCYEHGEGVTKDEVEAVKWYRKAAEQNDAQAEHDLGCCYANGQGVTKDYVEAAKWSCKAAEQNHPAASQPGQLLRRWARRGEG